MPGSALTGRTIVLTRPSLGTLGSTAGRSRGQGRARPADRHRTAARRWRGPACCARRARRVRLARGHVGERGGGCRRRRRPVRRDVRLAAVGPATAAALEARSGRRVDLVPANANSDGLLAAFPSAPAACSWRRPIAPATTSLPGCAPPVTTSSPSRPTPPALSRPTPLNSRSSCDADAVVLASGSAVEAWSRSAGERRGASVLRRGHGDRHDRTAHRRGRRSARARRRRRRRCS